MMTIGIVASPDWTDCPPPCLCKWTYGKKSALCASSNLTSVPTLNSDLQVLDLQQNFISYLKKDEFSSAGLLNLQRIFLKNSSLREIHRDAFRDLKILIEVDLSNNYISVIPRDTFAGNDRLKVLILSGNPLKQLFNEQFPTLPHLRSLELENCQIRILARDAFVQLDQLEKLNLRQNDLENLSEVVFVPLVSLKSLALEGNPWKCDCSLRAFRNWYLISKLHSVSLSCSEPGRLKGKLWEDIQAMEFACAPEVKVTEKMIREHAGGNVTFGCHIKGDPEPEVKWYFKGYQIGSPNATHSEQMLIEEIEGIVDKWVNVSIFNLTKADAGEYSCSAKNFLDRVVRNLTLYVQQDVVVVTLSKTEAVYPISRLVNGGVFTLVVVFIVIAFSCVFFGYQKRRSRHRRKGRIKDSGSFTDQDKKLLDVSITTSTERQSATQSMEMFGSCQGELKMPESSSSMTLELGEPVQIAIDRHNQENAMIPIATAYPTSFGLATYAPTLDYNSRILPNSGYGNIFISVSVSKDPFLDSERYPDLLEIPCKGKGVVGVNAPEFPFCGMPVSSYATLPRRPARSSERQQPGPLYDKLGRRVTMQGSSTLSLPDAQSEEEAASVQKEPVITLEVDEYVSL